MQNGKMAIWGGLRNSCEKKRRERQRRKGKIFHLNAEFQSIARRDKKVNVAQLCPTLATPWTTQPTEFSRSEYWSG